MMINFSAFASSIRAKFRNLIYLLIKLYTTFNTSDTQDEANIIELSEKHQLYFTHKSKQEVNFTSS